MRFAIDLQTHTDRSPDCGWASPAAIVDAAVARGLDGIAVTDHNATGGWAAARAHAPASFVLIPGEEVDTRDGQVIGLFIEERVEPGRSAAATIEAIHDQGGLAVAPHPFDRFRSGLADLDPYADALDAVEVVNARCLLTRDNRRAADFAADAGLPAVGGSDGHFAREIGAAYTVVDVPDAPTGWGASVGPITTDDRDGPTDAGDPTGGTADELAGAASLRDAIADAIRAGRTQPAGDRSSPAVHAGTLLVKRYNRIARAL